MIFDVLDAMIRHQFSWLTILAIVLAYLKGRQRGKERRKIDYIIHRLDGGDQCSGIIETSWKEDPWSSKRLFSLLRMGRNPKRRVTKMREYLKKIGSRKFQALITSLIINIVTAILFISGTVNVDEVINTWMPLINMTIATVSTWVYILVEGGIDKENARKEVNAIEPDYDASDLSDKYSA